MLSSCIMASVGANDKGSVIPGTERQDISASAASVLNFFFFSLSQAAQLSGRAIVNNYRDNSLHK